MNFNVIQLPGPGGKNLFNKSGGDYLLGNINSSGQIVSGGATTSYWVEIKPNTNYHIHADYTVSGVLRYGETNEKPVVGATVNNASFFYNSELDKTITMGNSKYFVLSIPDASKVDILSSLQIEEGSTATAYEPYLPYKFYGDIVVPLVPAEYECVEYLTCNGNQQIEFPFNASLGMINAVVNVEISALPASSYGCVIGSNSQMQAGYNTEGYAYVGTGSPSTTVKFTLNTKYIIDVNITSQASAGTYYVDGIDTGLTRTFTGSPYFLFSNGSSAWFAGKFYHATMVRTDKKILDLYPARRKSDNKLGLYDIVNGDFYINESSTDFTGAGNVVLPPSTHYMLANGGTPNGN